MSWKLYEVEQFLREALEAADAAIDQDTGEIPEDWAKFLDEIQMDRDKKCLSIAALIRELSAEKEAIEIERKRLQAREKTASNKAASLKSYLSTAVKVGEKIKDNRVSIGWSHRESVNVTDESKIPDAYIKIERTPKLTEIKDAIKAGSLVEGAEIVDNHFITIR